jgi:dihydrofolate synthase/folylpolyglutamate synthase
MSAAELRTLLQQLIARFGRGPQFGLDGVRRALALVGDPHLELACVHVAGTNGKGSVCAMIEAVARAAGLRTGMYTSPHLCRFAERIRIAGEPVDDDSLSDALRAALAPRLPRLTFFEAMTVAGFHAMRRAEVDLAVVEVGLGGRLDATNVLERPLAAAVVSIGLDHVEYLGNDLASIAREKAGIIKAGCPLTLGPLERTAEQAIVEIAVGTASGPVWRVEAPLEAAAAAADVAQASALRLATPGVGVVRTTRAEDGTLHIVAPDGREARPRLGLEGPHQASNAAVAAAVLWQLEQRWPALGRHLDQGLSDARWPGRLETIEQEGRRIILDCAHNPAGVEALARALGATLDPARTSLLFGAMSDKLWRPMLLRLAPLAARRCYTEPLRPLGARHSVELTELSAVAAGERVSDPERALQHVLEHSARGDTVLVTGSIFLVGAVRARLLGLTADEAMPA